MHTDSHRTRFMLVVFLLTFFALLLARPSHGGWSAEPVAVHATSALCAPVASVDDAHAGAIVIWQEQSASGGLLQARHLLASGDLDPAWPGAVAVCDRDAARVAMGGVSDAAGGAYVWWIENLGLMLTHIAPDGALASGWPIHGRSLGTLVSSAHRPLAVADGTGGVYVGWLTPTPLGSSTAGIRVVHLDGLGAGAGGWPINGRTFGLVGVAFPTVASFGIDVVPSGGLWLGWQTEQLPEPGMLLAGQLRVLRVTAAGLPAPGWASDGVFVSDYAPVPAPGWSSTPRAAQVAVANDGAGGVHLVSAQAEDVNGELIFHNTLRHLDAAGGAYSGLPVAGTDLGDLIATGLTDPGAPASLRAFADGRGGVYAGRPTFASESGAFLGFDHRDPAGGAQPGGLIADQRGLEFAARDDGGMFLAAFKPSGATGPFEADAYIRVSQSDPGANFFESKVSFSAIRYGDVGLSATRDGGAIFAWSQLIDRQGVFAIRLNPAGAVAGVTPVPAVASLHARFVAGRGVLARLSLPEAARVTLALHDLTGRRLSRLEVGEGMDVAFPGTSGLASGVYFVRATGGPSGLHTRVIVLR